MKELITINYESENPTVSARELHELLEVKTAYKDWFPRMCEYGFAEGHDFNLLKNEQVQVEGVRTVCRTVIDAALTIPMAKEICMLQRNEKGKIARRYFLELEQAWNTPEQVFARALKMADREIEKLKANTTLLLQDVERMKPKEVFADAVSASHTSILIGDLAKILKQNGYETGQKRLFDQLRLEGYLIKSGASRNLPTQKSMDLGLFEVKETAITNPDGSVRVTKTTKVTGKGQQYFINRYLSNKK